MSICIISDHIIMLRQNKVFEQAVFKVFEQAVFKVFEQAIGPGVLQTFSTCAVKH